MSLYQTLLPPPQQQQQWTDTNQMEELDDQDDQDQEDREDQDEGLQDIQYVKTNRTICKSLNCTNMVEIANSRFCNRGHCREWQEKLGRTFVDKVDPSQQKQRVCANYPDMQTRSKEHNFCWTCHYQRKIDFCYRLEKQGRKTISGGQIKYNLFYIDIRETHVCLDSALIFFIKNHFHDEKHRLELHFIQSLLDFLLRVSLFVQPRGGQNGVFRAPIASRS